MICKALHEHYSQYTFESISNLTIDQIYILAADEKTLRLSPYRRTITGTAEELRQAGVDVDGPGTISLLELLQGKVGKPSRKQRRAERLKMIREAHTDGV